METIIDSGQTSQDVVAAMFEDSAAALAAQHALIGAGVDPGAIRIVQQPGETAWNGVKDAAVPIAHAHVYAEGAERGHALLFVTAPAAQQAQVMDLLEDLQPIDVMSRVREWHEAGWNGVHSSQPDAPPPMLFEDAAYPDHLPATGLLNEQDRYLIGGRLLNPMGIPVPGVRTTGTSRVRRYEADPGTLGGGEF